MKPLLIKIALLFIILQSLSACYRFQSESEIKNTEDIATIVQIEDKRFIYLVSSDGSNYRKLINLNFNDSTPVAPPLKWSPDRNTLLFSTLDQTDQEVSIINVDGTGFKHLTQNQDLDYDASWSPDGKQILYLHKSETEKIQIRVMDSQGKSDRLLIKEGWDAHWSPDSKKIAFTSQLVDKSQSVYILAVDGSRNLQRLSYLEGDNSEPSWSPDGKQLVYTHCKDSSQSNCQLRLIQANGSQDRELTPFEGIHFTAVWSPDGTELVYGAKTFSDSNRAWIEIIKSNGTGRRKLFNHSGSSFGASWSPNSKEIVFHLKEENTNHFVLGLIRRNGSALRFLPEVPGQDANMFNPYWAYSY